MVGEVLEVQPGHGGREDRADRHAVRDRRLPRPEGDDERQRVVDDVPRVKPAAHQHQHREQQQGVLAAASAARARAAWPAGRATRSAGARARRATTAAGGSRAESERAIDGTQWMRGPKNQKICQGWKIAPVSETTMRPVPPETVGEESSIGASSPPAITPATISARQRPAGSASRTGPIAEQRPLLVGDREPEQQPGPHRPPAHRDEHGSGASAAPRSSSGWPSASTR